MSHRRRGRSVPGSTPDLRHVDVDGVRLRISVRGKGRPLLIITGLGAGLELAAPFEDELCVRGHQVIGFDAPGIGGSTGYRWPRRLPGMVRTIERLVADLGHERVDVLGVSLGGAVAQQLARSAPERVAGLVLAATGPGVGGIPGAPHVLLSLATPRRYRDPEYFRQIAGRVYGGVARRDPVALLHAGPRKVAGPPSTRAYASQLFALVGWSSVPWLHRLPHPTLVMAGDDDPIVPVINSRLLARRIPDSRLHVVRGGGHLFILERPAEIADVVSSFLEGTDPRGARA
jgi:poly(3-hydroxyoctanoate) depolymerase